MSRLELAGLRKRFGEITAVDDVALDVPAGSRVAVVGPSGCGKTTLLRLVAGFEAPDAGRIYLDGETLSDGAAVLPAHRRRIGIVMQDGALFPHLSVAANVGFALDGGRADRRTRVEALMRLVGLPAAMLDRRPDQLSGGQQQRVALARALACEPRLMLLDEPFSALDAGLRAATRDAVADLLTGRGVTTVLVTHDQGEALGFAHQVAVMRQGRIRRFGPPHDVYLRPGDAEVATFLGEAILLEAEADRGSGTCGLGRLSLDDRARVGRVRVMLRPEQLRIARDGDPSAVSAEVLATTFHGPSATVRVRLDTVSHPEPLTLSLPGFEAPEAGCRVAVAVAGTAHVLDG